MMKWPVLLFTIPAILGGCSIKQVVEPAKIGQSAELCIIENEKVREGFLREFRSVLQKKGLDHRVVAENTLPAECKWTARYTARWSWDFTIYMSYAEIRIFRDGRLDGEAVYDSTGGGANMNKFIDAEPKIRELLEQLLDIQQASLFGRVFG